MAYGLGDSQGEAIEDVEIERVNKIAHRRSTFSKSHRVPRQQSAGAQRLLKNTALLSTGIPGGEAKNAAW
jgi:hypothetical protein